MTVKNFNTKHDFELKKERNKNRIIGEKGYFNNKRKLEQLKTNANAGSCSG